MDARVDRVQAKVTVWIASTGFRVVEIDYAPGYGDPLASALLDKAQELNLAAAVAYKGPPSFGGVG